jgi:ABC-type branched-subunit amino acid transport system substrate-binding protein
MSIIIIKHQNIAEKQQETMIQDNMVEVMIISPRGIEQPEYEFLAELAEQDINNYMNEQKHPHRFNFTARSADGTSINAYNLAKQHYDNGNRLIVGLSWSSQLDTCFSFAQSNDCLIISPGSTQTWPWKLAPNTYRMYPADHLYTVPLVRCVESRNISKVVLVQLEGYMKTMDDDFLEEYSGEVSTVRIEYDSDYSKVNSSTLLLEDEIKESIKEHGESHVAVYFIGSSYLLEKILDSATENTLYNVPWFVLDWFTWHQDPGTRYSRFEENKTQLTCLQLLGVHPAIPDNPTYSRVNQVYLEEFNQPVSMIHGNIYDALWITALAVAETNSTDGTTVGLAIPNITKNHTGVTGNCSFNDWGDRWGVDWIVYGYDSIGNQTIVTEYGFYNYTTDEVTWRDG